MFFPTLIGLTVVAAAARVANSRYLAAYALGLYFWFFSDTMGDSAYIGVNSGFGGGPEQLALVLLYAAGVIGVLSLDRTTFKTETAEASFGFNIPMLVAIAVGLHGFGEAAAFSGVAASTPATDFFGAFGGLSPAAAFIVHKTLEPIMVGAAYWVYAKHHAKNTAGIARDILVLAVIFVLPGAVGAATNYYLMIDTTYVFALSLGASFYAAVRLAKPLFWESTGSDWEWAKVALPVVLGFLSLYFAALLHA
jgi:hypothetical protein